MPRYRSRSRTRKDREKKRIRMQVPRDRRKLAHWAVRGTHEDYKKLHHHAIRLAPQKPNYVSGDTMRLLQTADRRRLVEATHQRDNHGTLDGLAWLLDKVPWGNWIWPVSAAQSVINAQKGDSLNEVDELYARLVGATYGRIDGRPFVLDHWRRQTQFDGAYISVWDNPDGHRVICIRGTEGGIDIAQDALIALIGTSTDAVGSQLLSILAATPESVVVDLAAHSLGTSLALAAYGGSGSTFDRIHESYLYNPAYSPLVRGTADAYERDSSVRYFINLNDAVSMGSYGHRAPSNVVFRSEGSVLTAHKLAQWQGSGVHPPQFHAPPETRVHAHKAVFGRQAPEEDLGLVLKEDYVGTGGEDPPSADADAEEPLDQVPFDFGADFQYVTADG